jgi:hypothetical protein
LARSLRPKGLVQRQFILMAAPERG